ncbi:COMM domain-containing protein 3-like [Limulus polyphemus]|uniref:COMM domain-containing protein 3 n=1 Tax=Limulus polyphemus TaxID=6850 RepID=A0ABM1TFN8_LIMPO|nr:COMM domain-containing protein 3-like [Limulus polyphemus]
MQVSKEVLEGISLLGDVTVFQDDVFKQLLDLVFEEVFTPLACSKLLSVPVVSPMVLKKAHAAVVTFAFDAAKWNADNLSITSILEDCKLDSDRISNFLTLYDKNKTKMQSHLSNVGSYRPHIVDVDWTEHYVIKSSNLERISLPSYIISLKTESLGQDGSSNSDSTQFVCTLEQLQDLVGQLKDAVKSLERISQGQ